MIEFDFLSHINTSCRITADIKCKLSIGSQDLVCLHHRSEVILTNFGIDVALGKYLYKKNGMICDLRLSIDL